MEFHFTRPRATQHLLIGVLLALAIAAGATPAFRDAWRAFVESTSDRVALVLGLWVLHALVFWPVCGAFHLVDETDRPAFVARHRIQTGRRVRPPMRRVLWVLVRNQVLFLLPLLWLLGEVLLARGWHADPELPGLGTLLVELAVLAVAGVFVFYVSHRFLHRKWWMKRVHKVHHEFRTTAALAAEYAHPVEFAVGNFGTVAAGALLIAPHLASMYLFAVLALLTILVHHSGYSLPWAPYSVPHDWHHYKFKEVFGTTGLLDKVFGTEGEFATLREGDVR